MAWTKTKKAVIAFAVVILAAIAIAIPRVLNLPVKGIPEGWSVINGNPDQWTWRDGKIHGHSTSGQSILASQKEYRDVTISAVATTTNREASFALRLQDANHGYLVVFVPPVNAWAPGKGFIELVKLAPGNDVTLAAYHGRVMSTLGPSAQITASAKGPWIEVRLNDVTVIRTKDTTYASGFIGLRVYGWGDRPCDATYSYLRFH